MKDQFNTQLLVNLTRECCTMNTIGSILIAFDVRILENHQICNGIEIAYRKMISHYAAYGGHIRNLSVH